MTSITRQKQDLQEIIVYRVMKMYDAADLETQRAMIIGMTTRLARLMTLSTLRAWNLGMAARKEEREDGP